MEFRKITGFAAALLLISASTMTHAEPLERSPRPQANPKLLAAMPGTAPDAVVATAFAPVTDSTVTDARVTNAAGREAPLTLAAVVPAATAGGFALIGPVLPADLAWGEGDAQPVSAAAQPRAPVNPRLGALTLSSSNRPAPSPLALPVANAPALPELGEMQPSKMPGPGDFMAASTASAAIATPASPPVASTAAASLAAPEAAILAGPRPKLRPAALEQKVAAARAAAPVPPGTSDPQATEAAVAPPRAGETANAAILTSSLRPKKKPAQIVQLASAAAPAPAASAESDAPKGKKKSKEPVSAKGSVCGVAAIKGEKIAPITSKVQGCGLEDGVRVTSVSGVRLSMAATIDCATAKALNRWVEAAAQPAYGGQIVELQLAGHYVCRPRNNKKGAKVSEHGRGKAVDISGLRLASGKVVKVLGGFDKTMRKAHKGACGIFGTTLGPGSDGYHEDHMHFDTASHRSGAYCR